jgi:hypothetical protein
MMIGNVTDNYFLVETDEATAYTAAEAIAAKGGGLLLAILSGKAALLCDTAVSGPGVRCQAISREGAAALDSELAALGAVTLGSWENQ